MIVMVPIFAVGVWALYRRKRFYTEHLVFAFYTYACMLSWMHDLSTGCITLTR